MAASCSARPPPTSRASAAPRTTYGARRARADDFLLRSAATKTATPVRVQVNIADPVDVDAIDIAACDGVGLMRTEFLFGKASGLPDEEAQYAAYRKVLEWAGGKPVTIRTVDAGGDKPVPGFTVEESNPFLGLRGIRLSLARPEIFRVQIRALLRAAPHGNLKVMFPMIAVVDEYDRAAALFAGGGSAISRARACRTKCRRWASWSRCPPWRWRRKPLPRSPSSRSAPTTSPNM